MEPIYSRRYEWCPRPHLYVNKLDFRYAWRNLNPIYTLDKARPAFSQLYDIGAPNIVFIGASQPHHLREALLDENLYSKFHYKVTDFLSASEFIAVGGLTFGIYAGRFRRKVGIN